MSLIKKSDVKNHLSPRHRTKIHLCEPEMPSGTIGSAVAQRDGTETKPSNFAKDFIAEHSSSGIAFESTDPMTGLIYTQTPPVPKNVQA